jgi:hypothetical protein
MLLRVNGAHVDCDRGGVKLGCDRVKIDCGYASVSCDDDCMMNCDYVRGRGYELKSMTLVHDGHDYANAGHENARGSSRDALRKGHYEEFP